MNDDKWQPVVDAIHDNVVDPSDAPETDAVSFACGGDAREEATNLFVHACRLERDRDRIRARSQRQRRELRRLNKTISALWRGANYANNMQSAFIRRSMMVSAFGEEAVRAAEQAHIKLLQDEMKVVK